MILTYEIRTLETLAHKLIKNNNKQDSKQMVQKGTLV